MRKISCLIVDDEPLALELLYDYLKRTPFLLLKGQCNSAFNAMEILEKEAVELLFMDIQMPGLTGLDFYRSVAHPPKVIFTTAYSEYAVEGFKVDALDYLLKPFNYPEFLKAANKAKEWFDMVDAGQKQEKSEEKEEAIFVKSEYRLVKIQFSEILYIEGLKDYVKIFTTTADNPILSLLSLKSLEEKLPAAKFMRVHRSFIVGLGHVKTIERSRILFGKERIPIGDSYREKFQQYLDNRM